MSAARLADERLGNLEIIGCPLVSCAGILEVWPIQRAGRQSSP
jgi:hypothetical protein